MNKILGKNQAMKQMLEKSKESEISKKEYNILKAFYEKLANKQKEN